MMLYGYLVCLLTVQICFFVSGMDSNVEWGVVLEDDSFASSNNGSICDAHGIAHNHGMQLYGKGVAKNSNRIIVFDGSRNTHEKVDLTGIKKQIFLSEAIHTVNVPTELARVIPQSSEGYAYIECDEAVDDAEVVLAIKEGTLDYFLPANSIIEFSDTQNKPLFTVYAHLINSALRETKNPEKMH